MDAGPSTLTLAPVIAIPSPADHIQRSQGCWPWRKQVAGHDHNTNAPPSSSHPWLQGRSTHTPSPATAFQDPPSHSGSGTTRLRLGYDQDNIRIRSGYNSDWIRIIIGYDQDNTWIRLGFGLDTIRQLPGYDLDTT